MSRQGRILIVDDLENWRKELSEILQNEGFYVETVSTTAEALTLLNTQLYHVVVLDVRLEDTDQDNRDGIAMLEELAKQGLDEAIKVIMFSKYADKEQTREVFKDYEVADFLFKDKLDKNILLESVQRVFSQKLNINLTIDIHWQQVKGPEQAVLNLEVGETYLKRKSPLQAQIALELNDLLCRLFHQAESVQIRPLTPGWSGAGVLRAQPFYKTTRAGRDVVVKFGDIGKINKEYQNFTQYVQPFTGGGRNTTVLDMRRTARLGGITYSFLGTNSDRLVDFGHFYRVADTSMIMNTLDRLFLDTCGMWYADLEPMHPLNLSRDYEQLFNYSSRKFERILSKQLPSIQGRQKLTFKSLNSTRTFTNPLLVVDNLSFVCYTYTCTTHGDFNPRNLLVDTNGYVWLIDFQSTGPSHILRDVAMLDSVIRFQLLTAEQATLEERLEMEEVLSNLGSFSQLEHQATSFAPQNQALAKAYAVVVHLRTLAGKLMPATLNRDINEYNVALLYSALNNFRFSSLSTVQREHALLCASLLTDQLGL